MERFTNNVRLLWRSERLLAQQEIRMGTKKLEVHALAGLVGIFGLGMLGLALFFAIEPYWGKALAALAVGGIDLIIVAVLTAVARSMKPAPEVAMVREMRDVALEGIRDEAALAEAEINNLRDDIRNFVRNPFEALLPAIVSPMLGAVTRGLHSSRKK
jgi:hypothetical protein